ncbi:hypothetical protein FOZ60_003388 [Perkinsus olseni]|uniref:Uncharacterized protein n=1 Tax=Perkinsus olseni TaxID=32597 RepID=A0A7J6PHX1_PEROL|nr:hypothetical protein FOZ60_003388 [Perkinsus olseni]
MSTADATEKPPQAEDHQQPGVESEMSSEGEDIIRKSTRRSKPVEHFAPPQKRKVDVKKKVQAGEGKGIKLGDIEVVSKGISKAAVDGEGLKRLHVCLFNSIGKESTRKRDIRAWNGSQSAEDRERMEKTLTATKKQESLREIARTLGLPASQSRTALEESILRFLDVPKDEGLKKPKTKRRASATGRAPSRGAKGRGAGRQGSGFSNFLAQRTKELKATEAGKLLTPKEVTEMLSVEWTSMSSVEKAAFGTPQKAAGQKRKRSSTAGGAGAKTKKPREVSEPTSKAEESSSDDSSSDTSSSSSSSSSRSSASGSEENSAEESQEETHTDKVG